MKRLSALEISYVLHLCLVLHHTSAQRIPKEFSAFLLSYPFAFKENGGAWEWTKSTFIRLLNLTAGNFEQYVYRNTPNSVH